MANRAVVVSRMIQAAENTQKKTTGQAGERLALIGRRHVEQSSDLATLQVLFHIALIAAREKSCEGI